MKQVLVLTGRYLPNMSPNGVCINNIIQNLPSNKYKVTCICYDDNEKYLDEKIDIIRVSRGPIKSLLYRFEKKKNGLGRLIFKMANIIDYIIEIPFLITWPWDDPLYTYKVYKIADKLQKKMQFDYIIAIHMPISSLIVANKLKKKYPQIKYIPYFLDSLSGGRPNSIFSEKWNRKKKLKWEIKLLPNADRIVVMEASRKHHEKYSAAKKYYQRFVYLDIPLLCKQDIKMYNNPFLDEQYTYVTFAGSALEPMRNMQFFVKLAQEVNKIDSSIMFVIIGQCNCRKVFESDCIKYFEPMPHDQLLPYLQNSSVFINMGVTIPSAISGKIFEYMTFGKPIISTYSITNEPCIPYLKQYPNSLLIDENESDITKIANIMIDFIYNTKGRLIEYETIKRIYKNNLPETFIKEIFEKD